MRADADFMVYVGARWPALLRDAVQLGCPPSEAAEAVSDALSRCRRDWGRASREENVDHLVHEALREATRRRARVPVAEQAGTERSGTEQSGMEPGFGPPVLAPPSLEELRERESDRNRRTAKRVAAVGVPLLLVVSGAAYVATGSPDSEPPRSQVEAVAISREANPAPGVVWFAEGRLHLENSVLEIEDLTDMTAIGSGVVYGDSTGRVVYAGDDGSRALLGHKDPAVPVAATDETGVAAWYDPATEEVVAVQAARGAQVLRTGVDDRPRVVAVDGDVIYLAGEDGVRALLPTGPTSERPVGPGELLDVRSRVRVFQVDEATIHIAQSMFNVSFTLPGRGARLAPDGNSAASRPPGDEDGVLLYDTRSGEELSNGLAPGDRAITYAPGPRGTMAYVVRPAGADSDGALELRTCTVGEQASCEVAAYLTDATPPPVLAR